MNLSNTYKIGSLISLKKGKKPNNLSSENVQGLMPYVDIKSFETGVIDKYTDGEKCVECKDGDLLIVCDGSRSGLIGKAIEGFVGSTLALIELDGRIDKNYLYYFIQGKYQLLNKNVKGTGTPHLKQDLLKSFEIAIPSLEIQKQIVQQIEEQLSQLDSAVKTLKKTKQQLEVYRQAVLKDAFNRVVDVSQIIPIKDVCKDIKVGIVIKPSQYYTEQNNGIKAFRSANVREFNVNDSDWVYLTEEGNEQNKRSEVHTNDVLIVRSGYPGTACVVPEKYNGCNAIDILIAVPNTDVIYSEYLCAYTNSPYGRQSVREKKRGVAQAHLNVSGYSKIKIIVPNLDVQNEVVKSIKEKLSQCSYIENTVNQSLQQAEALRQSILKQAFEKG